MLNPVLETAATVTRCDVRTFAARIRLNCSLVKDLGEPTGSTNKTGEQAFLIRRMFTVSSVFYPLFEPRQGAKPEKSENFFRPSATPANPPEKPLFDPLSAIHRAIKEEGIAA